MMLLVLTLGIGVSPFALTLCHYTPQSQKKTPRLDRGTQDSIQMVFGLRFDRHWHRFRPRRPAAHFADFKTHEAPDGNIFAQLDDRLTNHLADGHTLVLDVVLFVEAVFLVELLHLTVDDFFDDCFGLAGRQRLRLVYIALFFEHFRRHFFAPHVPRIQRRDVHGDVVRKLLERLGARHEVRLAIQLHEHADLPAGVNVASYEPFRRFAHGFLCGRSLSFLSQDRDGLLDVAACFHERGAAIRETGIRPLAQFLYELCRDLHCWLLCTHPFFSLLSRTLLVDVVICEAARPEPLGAGPTKFPPKQFVLARFFVGRNCCLRRLRRRFHNALHEVAFLFLVLFVRARIDVLDAVYQRLIFRRLLIRHLRLLVSGVAFQHGIRNLRREQPDGAQRVIVSGNDPVHHVRIAIRINYRNHWHAHAPRFFHRD